MKKITLLTLALLMMSVVTLAQKPLPTFNLVKFTPKSVATPGIKNSVMKTPYKAEAESYTYCFAQDFNGWTTIDADGDGKTWYLLTAKDHTSIIGHDGEPGLATSASYASVALNPDNYLVSPKMKLDGSISFYANAQDAAWAAEHFAVMVSTASGTDPSDFTMVNEWTMVAAPSHKVTESRGNEVTRKGGPRRAQGNWYLYTIDLSSYAGAEGYVAIRHFNCTDFFRLNVDDITLTTSHMIDPYDPDLEQQPDPGLVTPPDDLETTEWFFSCFSVEFVNNEPSYTEYTSNIHVGIDAENNAVYVQGLNPYLPEAWIVGTLSGTEVTFPSGQFFGTYSSGSDYDFFFYGADNDFNQEDVVMSFDQTNGVMTMTSPTYVQLYYTDYSFDGNFFFSNVVLTAIPDVAATPAPPTIIGLDYGIDWNNFNYYYFLKYDIHTTDEEGNPILSSKLSYMFYVDVDQEVTPLTLTTDLYPGLSENMTVIPYGFSDGDDISPSTLNLNMDYSKWRRVGIQSIYNGGGEERKSEISWFAMYSHEVKIPAQGYTTFYIDEPVMLDAADAEAGAELLGVTAVTDEAVTVTTLAAADSNTPLLVFNGSDEKKTIKIIPTDAPGLEIALAPEFKGTLEDKTFSAADMKQADHYVLNQNNFVWVRDAGTIKAKRCWLEIANGAAGAAPTTLEIVRSDGTTGIGTIDNSQLTIHNCYDLQGRKLSNSKWSNGQLPKGIYILNGKKVVIK